jgi:hypothetical protein
LKLNHFTIIYVVIAITLFVITDIKTDNYVSISKEKENIDQCFNKAIDDATRNMIEIRGIENLIINKDRAVHDFFNSMYASLGIIDNAVKRELLNNYVPVIAITYEDGFYIHYNDAIKGSDNNTYLKKRWTEKKPYYYEDGDFIYGFTMTDTLTIYDKKGLLNRTDNGAVLTLDYHEVSSNDIFTSFRALRPNSFLLDDEEFTMIKKQTIISCIENALSYYCHNHNIIAEQFGITYKFALPVMDNSEWSRTIDHPSIIVLFQGYPLGRGEEEVYNRYAISGSSINRDDIYILEQKEWYFIYHRANCEELKKGRLLLMDEPCHSINECASKGAYACPNCSNGRGVLPPDYTP